MPPTLPEIPVFRHRKLSEPDTLRRVIGRALTRPLIATATPVMLITLFEALQGRLIADLLKYGFLVAFVAALGWSLLQLGRTPAVISFKEGRVRIQTMLGLALRSKPGPWQYVIDLSHQASSTSLTLGHRIYDIYRSDWDDFERLLQLLREAMKEYDRRRGQSDPEINLSTSHRKALRPNDPS